MGGANATAAASAFPTNTSFQYLNRLYSVNKVDAYVSTTTPAIAHFEPVVTTTPAFDNTMYYLSGGQGWNYYAYYPYSLPSKLGATGTPFTMPTTVSGAIDANFAGKADINSPVNFFDQTKTPATSVNAYPGPIMFAYYGTEDKQAALTTAQKAVRLPFKYAVAKLTLNVTIAETVTKDIPNQLKAIALEATGMNQGFTFDLTKAKTVGTTTGVYDVVTTDATATAMTAWTDKVNAPTFTPTTGDPYTGYLFRIPETADLTATTINIAGSSPAATKPAKKFTVTAYLIPAGNDKALSDAAVAAGGQAYEGGSLTGAAIKFYVSTQSDGKNPEVYSANLDQSSNATNPKNYLPSIAPGKEYQFNITLDKNAITFEGEIKDWEVVAPAGTDEIPAV